jgi:hypothetical protein
MTLTDKALIEVLKTLTECERRAVEACLRSVRPPTWFQSQTLRKIKARLKRRARRGLDKRSI